MSSDWLSLSEIAEELGVHPSTIRNWADQGRIPVHRTPGGHRRFRRDEVTLWQQADQANTVSETQLVLQNALKRTRFQISEGGLSSESWYQKLDQQARQQYRQSGRSLLQALSAYLSSETGSSADAEARALGYEYAVCARRHHLNLMEATQAFLFFRSNLLDAMYGVYEAASVQSPFVWSNLFRRITAFTDHVMITILDTFTAFDKG